MKQFINKVILISLPIFCLLVLVNYFGDAARLFDTDYEKQMSSILLKGNFITNINNYDERVFQKELITSMDIKPEIVVIGSSRTMLINSQYFPNKTFFNNSVSGATIEDLIALVEIYKEQNFKPKKIIIGIDPWLLNKNNGQFRWQSLKYYYNKYHNKYESKLISPSLYKYGELFSLSYFQPSIKNLPNVIKGKTNPISTNQRENETNTILSDGSLMYSADYRNASQANINSKISEYIAGDIYSIENFKTISDKLWNEFQSFITDLKKQNISVEFFLCPYAPIVFDKVAKKYPNVLKSEEIIVNFARNYGIKVYGSFSPYSLEFDETYFYDGMHCKEKGIKKILGSQ